MISAQGRPEPLIAATLPIISDVIQQHAEDIAQLFEGRQRAVSASHIRLRELTRTDDRIAAHLDGLTLAGEPGWQLVLQGLATTTPGAIFAAAVLAIEVRRMDRINELVALCEAVPEGSPGLIGAFGWSARSQLQGIVPELLKSPSAFRRYAGISMCAVHRVDPGIISGRRLEDPDPLVRGRALRATAELGLHHLVSTLANMRDDDQNCQFWAAWAAVLLGDRENALVTLMQAVVAGDRLAERALPVLLSAMPVASAHAFLRDLPRSDDSTRLLIRATGRVGDPAYVPWLIRHMADDRFARVAGESFSFISGVELKVNGLSRTAAEASREPDDDPEHSQVDMDDDDDLHWPDPNRVQAWWNQNGARFTTGVRHFMGAPPSRAHCIEVLKSSYQRQRIAAAYHLCLLNPGTPLFEWRAPAWRQQRELATLS